MQLKQMGVTDTDAIFLALLKARGNVSETVDDLTRMDAL